MFLCIAIKMKYLFFILSDKSDVSVLLLLDGEQLLPELLWKKRRRLVFLDSSLHKFAHGEMCNGVFDSFDM